MKIYKLKVNKKYNKPPKMRAFPPHSIGYNVETGFLSYLNENDLLTNDPYEADWHYIPILWSYWQLSNNYGKDNREEMQKHLNEIIIDDDKTFTVSEADQEPGFDIGKTTVFSANLGGKWIPVPIITLPHGVPKRLPKKKYLSNFVGTIKPWPIRMEMEALLKGKEGIQIISSKKGEELFVDTILESHSTLCPRGSALGSYRFYESMQLGVVPIMISDYDFRPFPDKIDWDSCSYFFDSIYQLPKFFNNVSIEELTKKGENAKNVWTALFFKWPDYILDKLCN